MLHIFHHNMSRVCNISGYLQPPALCLAHLIRSSSPHAYFIPAIFCAMSPGSHFLLRHCMRGREGIYFKFLCCLPNIKCFVQRTSWRKSCMWIVFLGCYVRLYQFPHLNYLQQRKWAFTVTEYIRSLKIDISAMYFVSGLIRIFWHWTSFLWPVAIYLVWYTYYI